MKTIMMALLGFFLISNVSYAGVSSSWRILQKESIVDFLLSSTLHEVHGDVQSMRGNLLVGDHLMSGEVDFSVDSMKTYNGIRDRKMMRMFESDIYPQIVYKIDSIDLQEGDLSSGKGVIHGKLAIHGVVLEYPIQVDVKIKEDKLLLEGGADISLKDFNLKAPGVLGIVRVKDTVTVSFQLMLEKV